MSIPVPPKRRRFVDLSPLTRSPAFARLWIGAAVSGIGAQLTIVAVGLLVFDITRSTFAVSLVGGIALLPMIVAGLWGGMLADAFDRRRVLLISASVSWLATIGLVAMAWVDAGLAGAGVEIAVWPLYLLTTLNAVAATITGATRAAVTPRILPTELIAPASALNGISIGLQVAVGPAVAGVLVATVGFGWTFTVDAVLFTAGFLGILTLPKLPPLSAVAKPGWASLVEGMRFLRSAPNIRMSFLVDIVAMTFGRVHVVFPAVGALVIGGGAITVGILTAAMAVGAFTASALSGPVAHVHRQGLAIGRAIMVYGAFVGLFGIVLLVMQFGGSGPASADGAGWFGSDGAGWFTEVGSSFARVNAPALILAAVCLFGMGVSDEVSAIFRQTILLSAVPDQMRGRLQGVFTVVVTGGPRVGDLYVGILATAVALWFPAVLGGVLIVGVLALILRTHRGFREYDARHPSL